MTTMAPKRLSECDFPPEAKQRLLRVTREAKQIFEERHGKIGGDGAQLLPSAVSPAMQRLQEIRARSGRKSTIKTVTVLDYDWYIRTINFETQNRIVARTPRNDDGDLIVSDPGVLTSLLAAMYECCLVSGPFDLTPYFNGWEEAFAQAADDSEDSIIINNNLFAEILKFNPEIWPKGAEALNALEKEQDAAPLVAGSSTSPDGSGSDGSAPMDSTEPPAR